jgi:hypothetical protein
VRATPLSGKQRSSCLHHILAFERYVDFADDWIDVRRLPPKGRTAALRPRSSTALISGSAPQREHMSDDQSPLLARAVHFTAILKK